MHVCVQVGIRVIRLGRTTKLLPPSRVAIPIWSFTYIGGAFCKCPYSQRVLFWIYALGPLILGNCHILWKRTQELA